MDILEFIENYMSEVQASADVEQIPVEEAFLSRVCDNLVESEVISGYEPGYFNKNGRMNKRVMINGFSYEEADNSYNLFVVDDLFKTEEMLIKTNIDKLLSGAEELVWCGIQKKYNGWEESSPGYAVAHQINMLYENSKSLETNYDLKKVRIFIFTNKQLSARFKNEKRDSIDGINVEFNIYDANRLFDIAKSGFAKEPVHINFDKYGVKGLQAILSAHKQGEFTSYLATIPGDVLAEIYLDKGTQVLEGNVRAFLSIKGKVNKGIRKTILENPEKFFILNNGITVTADDVIVEKINDELIIKEISNLQIVNGGQTTASLASAKLKEKCDLSKVSVMMKLSVLDNQDLSEKLVPEISRASNSQNKVDEADFFSNHPFHLKLQELSERTLAPAVDGNQFQTTWFYERARGQYTVQEMKLNATQTKAFKLKNPKSQILKKTDVAKYFMTYEGFPHETSKGAQFIMKRFSTFIQGTDGDGGFWGNNSSDVNQQFYKDLIAKTIIFKDAETLVSNQQWYKEIKAYRANIVAYSVALLAKAAKGMKMEIDLNRIWNSQSIYPELEKQLVKTTHQMYSFLTREDRETQNVTEWAKKEAAWKMALKNSWTILPEFKESLQPIEKPKKNDVTAGTVDSMNFVVKHGVEFWTDLREWGKKYLYLTPKDEQFINLAIDLHTKNKVPSDNQFKAIVKVYQEMVKNGFQS